MDEDEISKTSIYTNRAPLLLAFVVELLRYTMPKQPLSSRLSLAQAVVSANSKSKAANIGLAKATTEESLLAEGQPKVKILGRSIVVLKRGDYDSEYSEPTSMPDALKRDATTEVTTMPTDSPPVEPASSLWSVSKQITFKSSTFTARVARLDDASEARHLISSLLSSEQHLRHATHNAWGYRVIRNGEPCEGSDDDGETGCGNFILRLMRETNTVNAIVLMTRFYGGTMLGPTRWRLMRSCILDSLSQRLRTIPQYQAQHEGVALWALDLANASTGSGSRVQDYSVVGIAIQRPETARAYLLKSFATAQIAGDTMATGKEAEPPAQSKSKGKRPSKSRIEADKEENLGRLLGALRLLFSSWADQPGEMERKAWSWYTAIRPEVEDGPAGWGEKGWVRLKSILDLRRRVDQGKEH
ncbi:Protein IMPACT [Colletotrichum chlorophyti]|uniref:Protein IMPACT n=1 Tax=Colletotrichum chlorophyti TaxID=708187 RepID=A0A1Q8S3N4_9PEZI|nr:Protein IMPACT [Colletotrichum chlorophyti]